MEYLGLILNILGIDDEKFINELCYEFSSDSSSSPTLILRGLFIFFFLKSILYVLFRLVLVLLSLYELFY